MIELSLDRDALEDISKDLEATPREVKRAIHLALNEVGRAMKSRAAKELSKETGVKRAALKSRLLSFNRQVDGAEQTKIWVGAYRIPGHKAGARKTSGGVIVAGSKIPGGYIRNGRVYRRIKGKQTGVKVDISDHVLVVLDSDVVPLFESRFVPAFERKLRWLRSK